jgi:hypothetical protein
MAWISARMALYSVILESRNLMTGRAGGKVRNDGTGHGSSPPDGRASTPR